MAVYAVKIDEETRLIEAKSPVAALKHATKDFISIAAATKKDLIAAMDSGAKVESADNGDAE